MWDPGKIHVVRSLLLAEFMSPLPKRNCTPDLARKRGDLLGHVPEVLPCVLLAVIQGWEPATPLTSGPNAFRLKMNGVYLQYHGHLILCIRWPRIACLDDCFLSDWMNSVLVLQQLKLLEAILFSSKISYVAGRLTNPGFRRTELTRVGQETLMEDNFADDDIDELLAPIAVQLAYVQQECFIVVGPRIQIRKSLLVPSVVQ